MISTLNSSTNRITGLASGLETEDLVKQLTSTTRSKVEKAEQDKQILEWKQDAYREVSTALVEFHSKYFDSSSDSLFADSLKKLSVTSSDSSYISALSTSSSSAGSIYIKDIVSLASSAKLKSSGSVSAALSGMISSENLSSLAGKTMTVTLNGVSKSISFSERAYSSSNDAAVELSALLGDAFGAGSIQVELNGDLLSLSANTSAITLSDADDAESGALALLGFEEGASNRLSLSQSLNALSLKTPVETENVSFTINGKEFTFSAGTALNSVINSINGSDAGVTLAYSKLADSFTMTSKQTGAASAITFQDTEGSFLSSLFGEGKFTAGTDAVIQVGLNGETDEESLVTVTRNSNTFDLDGTVVTLNKKADADAAENVTIGVSLDTGALVEKITNFVTDYNALLSLINGKLTETKYKGFLPLTDEEKENLTESEQKTWTEKAKSGLLRSDLYLQGIASSLRSSLYTSVSSLTSPDGDVGLILSDIGITTGAYTDNGKLVIDSDKLRKTIESDPNGVLSLLTQKSTVGYSQYNTDESKKLRYEQSGLIWRMSDIVKNNISKIGIKGPLIELAGSPETNFVGITTYSKRIRDMEDRIDALNTKLLEEEDSYWTKFTQMETSLNSLNSQSSWLSSMSSDS
jgi:flagellar hook-associated protein 2